MIQVGLEVCCLEMTYNFVGVVCFNLELWACGFFELGCWGAIMVTCRRLIELIVVIKEFINHLRCFVLLLRRCCRSAWNMHQVTNIMIQINLDKVVLIFVTNLKIVCRFR